MQSNIQLSPAHIVNPLPLSPPASNKLGHIVIQLLEYPIPSQKSPSADISETESGIVDPLVSKRPEKFKMVRVNERTHIRKAYCLVFYSNNCIFFPHQYHCNTLQYGYH